MLAGLHRRTAGDTSVSPRREAPSSMAGQTSASTSSATNWGQGRDHLSRLQHEGIGRWGVVPRTEASRDRGKLLIDHDPPILSQPYRLTRARTWSRSRGPSSRAATGPRRRVCCPRRPARFTVLVFDQGEPGRTKDPQITGDGSPSTSTGGPYPLYTRAGYIENGNIQVDN